MCSHTVARGSGGMLPGKYLTKIVRSGAIWGVPKFYYQPRNQQFKRKKSTRKLICQFLSQIHVDEHVSTKINTY